MEKEEFVYVVESNKNFDDAVVSILKAVEQRGWTIFGVYDMKERLAAKGFEQKPLKIIEICSGKYSNKLLNKNRLVSLCMPCKINVFQEDEKIKIAAMKPGIVTQFFPEIREEDIIEIEKEIGDIINNLK